MINERIQDLLNEQFHKELFSANLYLAMSSYFLEKDLDGFANFFRIQAEEEMMHAKKQFDYVHEVDGKITIGSLPAPQTEFESTLQAFEIAQEHEMLVTRSINSIVKASLDTNDFATHNFMQWFIAEQVEEESLMRGIIAKIKLADGNKSTMYLLNEEMLLRKLETPPA